MGIERNRSQGEEIVLLIVGDNTESKSLVSDQIAAHEGAGIPETTKAGVRIFTSKSRNKVIIDTKAFPIIGEAILQQQNERQQIARQWISKNSLRRLLLGKLLSVICVLTSSVDGEISEMAYKKKFAWLDILGVMFQEHKRAIRILVDVQKIEGHKLESAKEHITTRLNEHGFINHIYRDLSRGDSAGPQLVDLFVHSDLMKSSRGDNVYCGDGNGSSEELERSESVPFRLEEPAIPKNPTSPPCTPWGPERVILFGKTGSGKSTLAQMLTKGKVEPNSEIFTSGSGIRGETKKVSYGQGRGWYVVDTPGFGEPNHGKSTVPTQVAEDKIKKFVKTIDGLFTHFLFVIKKDRVDELEVRLWRFFVCLFGNDINDHFSIVVSNADEDWMKENVTHLSEIFKGCRSFLCAEFPSSQPGDEEWEDELQEIRKESLTRVEENLAELSRRDVVCQFGDLSRTALMDRRRSPDQQGGLGDAWQNFSTLITRLCSSAGTETLRIDQDIVLLPS